MAVEDDPQYGVWSDALDQLKKANDLFQDAYKRGAKDLELYRQQLKAARERFRAICDEIDDA